PGKRRVKVADGVIQASDNIFLVADLPVADPCRHVTLEIRLAVDVVELQKTLYMQVIDQYLCHQRRHSVRAGRRRGVVIVGDAADRKSTRLNSSHVSISYAVLC